MKKTQAGREGEGYFPGRLRKQGHLHHWLTSYQRRYRSRGRTPWRGRGLSAALRKSGGEETLRRLGGSEARHRALGRKQLSQVAQAKQFLDSGGQVEQFQPAVPFFDC
jgi:hypothetical protein